MESVESVKRDDRVKVEQHDTLREVTTITIQTNDRGDTLKVVEITDRDRIRSKSDVRSKTDEVRVEQRDSVLVSSSKFQVESSNLSNPSNPSSFVLTLKWIFALICVCIILIITIKVCWRKVL